MKTPKNVKIKKVRKIYNCKTCNFISSNKKDYNRHVLTIKHSKKMIEEKGYSVIQNYSKNVIQKPLFLCESCGKKYKYKSGLCKHQKKCKSKTQKVEVENAINLNTTMKAFIETQKEDNKKNLEQMETFKNIIPKIGNTYNNKLSINVYLNEKCKDAMNITDFVENLTISLEDLMYTKNHGFVKGISNIFVKQLQDMEPTQRPIHCSDKKRLQFYVKDENKWEKDRSHQKINSSIENIAVMQIKNIKAWEEQNPNYLNDDELLMEWHSMIHSVMGGENEIIRMKNCDSIKKEISTTIEMKDELINK
jgi:hypothetical protein